jgi:hypothetical protein
MNVQNVCVCVGGGGRGFFIIRALSLLSPVFIFTFLGHTNRTGSSDFHLSVLLCPSVCTCLASVRMIAYACAVSL